MSKTTENEKAATAEAAQWKTEQLAKKLAANADSPAVSDDQFNEDLLDLCRLNQLQDKLGK